jgi:putative nucleotidyltransferase with HDIG domain
MASVNPLEISTAQGLHGLETLIAEVDKLVSLPDIYYRLEEAIVDPGSTTGKIAELLRSDPDLCARMLRMANSVFYSFPTTIETVERAVSVIGLRQIRELVLVTSVVRAFEGIPDELVNMSTFWEHSVAVGIMAQSLGKQARIANADSFYIPGLLHDIGRLVMYLKLPGLTHQLLLEREATACSIFQLERNLLGYSHTEVGARLLESWKLPQSIWEPVATHHNPAGAAEFANAACAIHIADCWVNTNRAGSTGSCYLLEMDQDALRLVGIDIAELHQIGLEAAGQTQEVVRQFLAH